MTRKIIILAFALSLLLPAQAFAATAQETLRTSIEQMLDILSEHAEKGTPEYQQQRDKLKVSIEDIFAFSELSARAVGPHWKRFDEAQKDAFIKAFSNLLGSKYLDRIQAYSNERVDYGDVRQSSSGNVEVQTVILQDSKQIPIDYRMTETDKGWRVYDVVIEGVSLVKNYRSQFMDIMVNGKPADLIAAVEKKASENK